VGRGLEGVGEGWVPPQESLAGVGEPHAALGSAAGHPLDELEAGRLLELAQVTPGIAIRHLERLGRLLERAALLDGLQQPRAAVAEFQRVAERHPDLELGLHLYMGASTWPPYPPTLSAPRRSRGAPRFSPRVRPPTRPPPPPGPARRSLGAPDFPAAKGPGMAPIPRTAQGAPAQRWRPSINPRRRSGAAADYAPSISALRLSARCAPASS